MAGPPAGWPFLAAAAAVAPAGQPGDVIVTVVLVFTHVYAACGGSHSVCLYLHNASVR